MKGYLGREKYTQTNKYTVKGNKVLGYFFVVVVQYRIYCYFEQKNVFIRVNGDVFN